MKNTKRKQSTNPTLTELLEPYLRDPPSLPPQSQPPQPQRPAPQPPPPASLHTVQRAPRNFWRRSHTSLPKCYHVHPRDFRALVQRLTGANAGSTSNSLSIHEEIQVENDHPNVAGIEEETMLPDTSGNYMDALQISSPRMMGFMGDNCWENGRSIIDGESSDMESLHR